MKDKKGEVKISEVIGIVIAIALGLILVSALMPTAMDMFYETSNKSTCWGQRPEGVFDNVTCNETLNEWGYMTNETDPPNSTWVAVTSGEDTAVTGVWWITPILIVVAILLIFVMAIRDQL